MKRTLVISLLICFLTGSVYAQLLVGNNGNVGVKVEEEPIYSYFSVNSEGVSSTCSYILSDDDNMDIGLQVSKRGTASTNHDYTTGFNSQVFTSGNSSKKEYGLYAHVFKNTGDSNSGRSYGVFAVSGNSTPGWNYGVFGTLYGNNNGAGVFGSSYSSDGGYDTSGRFAGYFHGDVKSTDAIYATVISNSSDYRLKENIESVDSEDISNILKLNVVKYNLKQRFVDSGDTATVQEYYYTDDSKLLERTHYGLLAQEIREIYPDLVYEGGDGYLSVNYIELIPLLIKTIQELKQEVNNLTNSSNMVIQRNEGTTNVKNNNSIVTLFQNNPNPFTENTTIKCLIPTGVISAVLYIYDMNGRQINSINIAERGEVSITIEGNSLDAGIYLYSLITDGMIVDTKRMILTK